MTGTRFAPGAGTAYVADDVIVLAGDPVVDPGLLQRCADAGDWDALLAATADLTATAVVHHDGHRLHVAVVGDVRVVVDTPDGDEVVAGEPARRVRTIDRPSTVRLQIGDADATTGDDEVYCVDGGAVPASTVSRRFVAADGGAIDPFDALFGPTVERTVEQAAVREATVPRRDPLGVLVFSNGARVTLDRPMVFGRNPRRDAGADHADDADDADDADRGDRGDRGDPVRLVRVASAAVSRRHAVIAVDRWRASIDDLGSSNGTWVTLPGRRARRIEPGHPADLVPGALVDLGGDVSFTVEPVA